MMNQAIAAAILLFASTQFIFIFGEISTTDRAQAQFAVNLLQKAAADDKSVILSPLSVSSSLFMVYLAADGKTKQQLQQVLGQSSTTSQLRLHFYKLIFGLGSGGNKNYTLNVLNRFYVRDGLPTKDSFQRVLKAYYRQTLNKFDIAKRDEVVKEVNSWVANNTNNKIKGLIKEDTISDDAVMFLVNAVYFKATWRTPFPIGETAPREFHVSESKKKKIPTMLVTVDIPYYKDNNVQVIKLPYIGENLEMIFVLPQKRFGLSNVLKTLTGDDLLKYINGAKIRNVIVKIPKFHIRGKLSLNDALKEIGVTDAFSTTADFGELIENRKISVSNVLHGGFIEINEMGTESGAATVVELPDRMLGNDVFNANQPFFFAIVKDLKTILFAGKFFG